MNILNESWRTYEEGPIAQPGGLKQPSIGAIYHLPQLKRGHRATTIMLPSLTAWMKDCVPHHPRTGYLPDNWKGELRSQLIHAQFERQPAKLPGRLRPDGIITKFPSQRWHYHQGSSTSTTRFRHLILSSILYRLPNKYFFHTYLVWTDLVAFNQLPVRFGFRP